nr:Trm112 family protein [Pseudonocardia sp. C8]
MLEILACPCDAHAPLTPGDGTLTCTDCGRSYPVTGGIPVLLLDEALPGTGPARDDG